jgi:hypothetical protein
MKAKRQTTDAADVASLLASRPSEPLIEADAAKQRARLKAARTAQEEADRVAATELLERQASIEANEPGANGALPGWYVDAKERERRTLQLMASRQHRRDLSACHPDGTNDELLVESQTWIEETAAAIGLVVERLYVNPAFFWVPQRWLRDQLQGLAYSIKFTATNIDTAGDELAELERGNEEGEVDELAIASKQEWIERLQVQIKMFTDLFDAVEAAWKAAFPEARVPIVRPNGKAQPARQKAHVRAAAQALLKKLGKGPDLSRNQEVKAPPKPVDPMMAKLSPAAAAKVDPMAAAMSRAANG